MYLRAMTSYIVAGARTPIGKMSGALASFAAADLGGFAISEALAQAGVAPDEVDHVIMGQVLMAGQGQVPSRQAAVKAGIPMSVPALNINKVCLSGLNSIYLAHQMVATGDADIVVAGGMESMTNAPYLADGARGGFRYGNTELRDAIIADGLWCAFDACLMGAGTEAYTSSSISRSEQDEFAARSNELAANAIKEGRLADEIVNVEVPRRTGDPILVEHDEGVRPGTTVETLAKMRPAFDPEGNITAANASQLSDGGSAVVVMSKAEVKRRGIEPLGEFVSYGMVSGPDNASLLLQPSRAIMQAANKAGIATSDLDLLEINEAFAAQAIANIRHLGLDEEKVNICGGGIALGHPIGGSGARVLTTLLHQMVRIDAKRGIVSLCLGGGNAVSMLVERD